MFKTISVMLKKLVFLLLVTLTIIFVSGITAWQTVRFFGSEGAPAEIISTIQTETAEVNKKINNLADPPQIESQERGSPTTIFLSNNYDAELDQLEDEIQALKERATANFPAADGGNPLYYNSESWVAGDNLFFSSGKIGIRKTADKELDILGNAAIEGKLTLYKDTTEHLLELYPKGNTGYLSSDGGALYINNTHNIGTGIGIYSNAGLEAEGNMINVKVDNPLYNQAAFYMNYDGLSNAVEIVSNTDDSSSNALSITNYNQLDSALGVIGYETGRGTIKVSHIGNGSDANASGISVDVKGTGTKAQGIYVDSTATGGTTGNLLRLRNQTIDRFVVDYLGGVKIGGNGFNTSITKYGNTLGDEFFVGTTGAFRVQRSATDSEAFRTQILGDSQGRWLGTADGKLKWGDGASAQDVVLRRSATATLLLDTARLEIKSPTTNTDLLTWTASDGSRLGRVLETSGGHGWFEVDDNTGAAKILFRADGGASYVNSGNFGIGTTTFGTNANKVVAIGNGTAPTTSIADGIQLFAVDFDGGDGSATSELRVRDEDGNTTTLSPHNFSLLGQSVRGDLDWAYYSEKDGIAINANMAEALRKVEQLTGQQLIFMKDLSTGQNINRSITPLQTNSSITLEEKQLTSEGILTADAYQQLLNQVENMISAEEIKAHLGWETNLVKFFSDVLFNARVVFKGKATFEEEVVLTKNTGSFKLPSGAKELKVLFPTAFSDLPSVFLSTSAQASLQVKEVSSQYFIVTVQTPMNHDILVGWLAITDNSPESFVEVLSQESMPSSTQVTVSEMPLVDSGLPQSEATTSATPSASSQP